MSKWWANFFDMVTNQLVVEDEDTHHAKVPALQEAIDQARRDWLQARAYFDNVTDPDLIDHAIYCIEAAEKKYMYLLKQAREQGLRISGAEMEKHLISSVPRLHHQSY